MLQRARYAMLTKVYITIIPYGINMDRFILNLAKNCSTHDFKKLSSFRFRKAFTD